MKFIKGAGTWRLILGTQTFFWPLTPPTPPPPRYTINQPLSKGLVRTHGGAQSGGVVHTPPSILLAGRWMAPPGRGHPHGGARTAAHVSGAHDNQD